MPDGPRIPVRASGSWRGVHIDADGAVRLTGEFVSIVLGEREHLVRIDRLDGAAWRSPALRLYAARDVLALTGHVALEPLAAQINRQGLLLPELTRTMHGLGSRRGSPGAEHDRFFAALLRARRAAEKFEEVESRLAAFDAARLERSISTVIAELAAERFPDSAPYRRALEAELLEHAERLFAALGALGEAALEVRMSGEELRLARWRDWTRTAHRVFEEADRCWISALPALAAAPIPKPTRRPWRRARMLMMAVAHGGWAAAAVMR